MNLAARLHGGERVAFPVKAMRRVSRRALRLNVPAADGRWALRSRGTRKSRRNSRQNSKLGRKTKRKVE
jgi:hypothetical protein